MQNKNVPVSFLSNDVNSREIENFLMKEEIHSLKTSVEHIGILCLDKDGKIKSNTYLDSISNQTTARTNKSITEIGNPCEVKEIPVWWHTHNKTLSTMSDEDRLSAGNLKVLVGNDYMCATGLEGYSCHYMDAVPPITAFRRWGESYFNELKKEAVTESNIFDLNKEWKKNLGDESDIHHLICTNEGKLIACSGVDWETGFVEFPVANASRITISGNVDISPNQDGTFLLLASPIDKKLNCIAIKSGIEHVLFCR